MLAARALVILRINGLPHLIHLLTDACPLVRVAAHGSGRNPSPDAVEPLIISSSGIEWHVRKGVVFRNCREL